MVVTVAQLDRIIQTTSESARGEGLSGQSFPRSDLLAQGFSSALIEDYDAKTRQLNNLSLSVNTLAQAVRELMQTQNP